MKLVFASGADPRDLDKTKVDPEQETAAFQKALIPTPAREPGEQYISLVPVAIQTPAQMVELYSTGIAVSNSRTKMHQNCDNLKSVAANHAL